MLFLLVLLLNTCLLINANGSLFSANDEQIKAHWSIFKANHGFHKLSSHEETTRFKLFKDNYHKVLEHNQEADEHKLDYRVSLNRFSALTREEYKKKLGLKSFKKPNATLDTSRMKLESYLKESSNIPDQVSYYNKMTPVKNQYSCGGCWSFSVIGVVEALYNMKNNRTKKFSEQQLIDCSSDNKYENLGCNGGYPSNAFDYVRDLGIVEENYYPYRATKTKCFENGNDKKPRVKISKNGDIPYGNEAYMKKIVGSIGPIAIGLDASQWGFEHYSSGIYSDKNCSPSHVNHAVIIAGYGSENGKDYWLIRNSWGPSWGINGYMKLARNKNNMCGVASMASYAVM